MNTFRHLTLTALCLVGFELSASVPAQARDIYADQAPPPPRELQAPRPRDGYVWAPGFWEWNDKSFYWVNGRWLVERRARHWVPDHWVQDDNRWHFVPGRWEQNLSAHSQ